MSLKKQVKTSKENAPSIPAELCLSTAELEQRLKNMEIEKKKMTETPKTPAIQDEKIVCWDIDEKEMQPALSHFIVIREVNFSSKTIKIEFVPFDEITSDVFGWSYRWATPVTQTNLVDVDVVNQKNGKNLYKTRIFEKELAMLQDDVVIYKKIWMDKVCVPQKSKYVGQHVAAMGLFYQKATTILREVRQPDGLPMTDYLSRAWTYQEARWGKTICDKRPSVYNARAWADILWGRLYCGRISELMYAIANIMARDMDGKIGSGNITFTALRNCIGSGKFCSFYVKNFRKHEAYSEWANAASKESMEVLELLEKIAYEVGTTLDQKLKDDFWKLPRGKKGNVESWVSDPRLDPACTGHFWIEVCMLRNQVDIKADEKYIPENLAEMAVRVAGLPVDRFIGIWAVLLDALRVPIKVDDPLLTWNKMTEKYGNKILQDESTSFMFYGPSDIAGMKAPHLELPSNILGKESKWKITKLECERIVAGIGDGTIEEFKPFQGLLNCCAVHVSPNGAVSLLVRHGDIKSPTSPYRRVAVAGRDLYRKQRDIFTAFAQMLQYCLHQLIDVDKIAEQTTTSYTNVMNQRGHMHFCFVEYLKMLGDPSVKPGKQGIYHKQFPEKFSIPPEKGKQEMTPLREIAYLRDKMSKDKQTRMWTKFETLDVLEMI